MEQGPGTGEERDPRTGDEMDMDTSLGGREFPPQRDFSNGARLKVVRDSVGQTRAVSRRHPSSSLLDCAGEEVRLVHLSPPLDEVPAAGVESRRSSDAGHALREAIVDPGDGVPAASCRGGSAPVCDRPAARRADSPSLEPPLRPVTSRASPPQLTGPVSEERREEQLGRGLSPVLPSGGRLRGHVASRVEVDGASGESSLLGLEAVGLTCVGEREERGEDVGANSLTGPEMRSGQRRSLPRPLPAGTGRGAKVVSGSRDIREYF